VALPRLVMKVGPHSLFVVLDYSGPVPRIAETVFYHCYIWQGWHDLLFTNCL
jgi:hypothetical protein